MRYSGSGGLLYSSHLCVDNVLYTYVVLKTTHFCVDKQRLSWALWFNNTGGAPEWLASWAFVGKYINGS